MSTRFEDLSPEDALSEAKKVADSYCDAPSVFARMCNVQGMFSRSIVVTLSDNTEVVVQLKDNVIDTSMVALANSLLGDVVPPVHAAKTTKVFAAYVAPFVPGIVWGEKDCSIHEDVKLAFQIGGLLGSCSLNLDSSGMIDRFVVPRLQKILAKEDIPDNRLRKKIEDMVPTAERLKVLPLAICHIDINANNIIIDDKGNISGLLDWEMASLLPLGMGAWGIRRLSTVNRKRVEYILEKTHPMAESFWKGFIRRIPQEARVHQRAVVDAMQIGQVFDTFYEGGIPDERQVAMLNKQLEWHEATFVPMCDI